MFNIVVAVALLFFCCSSIPKATAAPFQGKKANTQLISHCSVPNTVALTFDDGPYDFLKDVVDTLKAAGAKGTFFFNGNNARCIYNDSMVTRVQYAYDNGFQIASHTWAHRQLTNLTRDQVDSEMSRTEDAIRKITGAIPAFTRPPYGDANNVTFEVADARDQTLVKWDFDSEDALKTSVADQKKLYDDVVRKHPSNLMSLEHEIFDTSVHQVLPYAIKVLQGAGYKLVTVAECLDAKPYLKIGRPSKRDDTWKC